MIKKIFFLTAIFSAIVSFSVFAKSDPVFYKSYTGEVRYSDGSKYYPNEDILLYINGSIAKHVDVLIENDRSLVPVRIISENLGAQVGWSDAERKVTITENDIVLKIGSNIASVNGKTILLDAAPKIYNNLTYVPLRFVAENLNCNVIFAESGAPNTLAIGLNYIYVDSKEINEKVLYTKEQAQEILKTKLLKHLELFKENFDKNFEFPKKEKGVAMIKSVIEETSFSAEVSRYYVFNSIYTFIFDKYTGDIYRQFPGSETNLENYDETNPVFFINGYWVG